MELVTRPQFYLDITEEVEYLARRSGPNIATRWHAAVDQTIQQLLRCFGETVDTRSRVQRFVVVSAGGFEPDKAF